MEHQIDMLTLKWKNEPKLHIQNSDRITLETEPFTSFRYGDEKKGAEIYIPVSGSFMFSFCTEYIYNMTFDQCGFILYSGSFQKAVIGTEKKDEEYNRIHANVFYPEGGDHSGRDIGSALSRIYFRVWYRGGDCRIQYSFAGSRYTDLREFMVDSEVGITGIGLYACSPKNSTFDCTFYDLKLTEE